MAFYRLELPEHSPDAEYAYWGLMNIVEQTQMTLIPDPQNREHRYTLMIICTELHRVLNAIKALEIPGLTLTELTANTA